MRKIKRNKTPKKKHVWHSYMAMSSPRMGVDSEVLAAEDQLQVFIGAEHHPDVTSWPFYLSDEEVVEKAEENSKAYWEVQEMPEHAPALGIGQGAEKQYVRIKVQWEKSDTFEDVYKKHQQCLKNTYKMVQGRMDESQRLMERLTKEIDREQDHQQRRRAVITYDRLHELMGYMMLQWGMVHDDEFGEDMDRATLRALLTMSALLQKSARIAILDKEYIYPRLQMVHGIVGVAMQPHVLYSHEYSSMRQSSDLALDLLQRHMAKTSRDSKAYAEIESTREPEVFSPQWLEYVRRSAVHYKSIMCELEKLSQLKSREDYLRAGETPPEYQGFVDRRKETMQGFFEMVRDQYNRNDGHKASVRHDERTMALHRTLMERGAREALVMPQIIEHTKLLLRLNPPAV